MPTRRIYSRDGQPGLSRALDGAASAVEDLGSDDEDEDEQPPHLAIEGAGERFVRDRYGSGDPSPRGKSHRKEKV